MRFGVVLDWIVRFPFMHVPHHLWNIRGRRERALYNEHQDKWRPTSIAYICSEYLSQQNAIWYEKETDFDTSTSYNKYPDSRFSVVQKREAHIFFFQRHTLIQISVMHW